MVKGNNKNKFESLEKTVKDFRDIKFILAE